MKKYCCLLNGENFLVRKDDGSEIKKGFYQKLIVQANDPDKAKLLATTRIWHDDQIKKMIHNPKEDPPKVRLVTIWELDLVNDPDEVDPERFFYTEYKWWQFMKRREEKKKLMEFYGEIIKSE